MKLSFLACLLATFGASAPVTAVEPQHKVAQVAEQTPVVVLGGGVGALTSALYLSRAGLQPIVIEGPQPGGLITQSHAVQNWPGEFEITGHELAEKVRKQAEMNGVRFYRETVTKVDFSKRPFQITTRSLDDETERTLQVESVVIAMGTKPNHLGVPGETGLDGYWGRGVTNCAICDGNLYRDAVVGVVGGGDAAVLEGLYLSNIAKQVNLFVRKDSFKGVEGKRLEALLSKSNVKVFFDTTVEEIKGDGAKVTSVALKTKNKELQNLPLDGLFLAIGSTPNTQIFKGALDLDPQGYISLKKDQETSVAGVYAIGDIVDPVFKQAISAAGDGAKAALQMQQYLSDRASDLIAKQNIPAKPVVLAAKHEVLKSQVSNSLKESCNLAMFLSLSISMRTGAGLVGKFRLALKSLQST